VPDPIAAKPKQTRKDGQDRLGALRKITDDQVEQVVVATLESTLRDATHWSRASMAKQSGVVQVRGGPDLEGVPERAVVLCVDEKSQVQALDRVLERRSPPVGVDKDR
jgi:hypothetical protein